MTTPSINKYYDFSVYATSVLGVSYSGAKLISILDYYTALTFSNIQLKHKQVYPYLPPGTDDNNTNYTYYLFEYLGKKIVLADVWIITASITETLASSKTIRLNNISQAQFSIVRDQLRLLGISFDIV